ncbi:MAG: DUF1028 domain-containing protein [Candidatus Kryptonium sp.]
MRAISIFIIAILLLFVVNFPTDFVKPKLVATFSIVAFDPVANEVGVAVQSKFPNVRPIVPWAKANVGAIATQSFANVGYGPTGLALLENGATAEQVLQILLQNDPQRELRQVGIVDFKGNSASWTGSECFDWAGGIVGYGAEKKYGGKGQIIVGKYYAVQGNILVDQKTVEAMAKTFEETKGTLADRLVAALVAGGKAGGDKRGEQSAALLVVKKGAGYDSTMDNYIDISIYDHPKPLDELQRLYNLHKLYFFKSDPKNLVKIDEKICRELQQIMKDRGFYDGPVNGVFDEKTKKSLQNFMGWENYDVRMRNDDLIDIEVLQDIRKNYEVWKAQIGKKK